MRPLIFPIGVLVALAATTLLVSAALAATPAAPGLAQVDSLIGAGRPEDALPLLQAMAGRDDLPEELSWPIYQRLGFVFEALGENEQALDSFETAAIRGAHEPTNHRNLGTLLMKMGRTGRALSEIREASELAPGDWRLRLEYSQALEALGQVDPARRELAAAEAVCPDCPQVHRAWARFHLARQDYGSAVPHLEAIYRQDPDPGIRKQLALARLRVGRPQEARILLLPDWPVSLDPQEIRIVLEADLALGEGERAAALVSISPDFTAAVQDPDLWALASLVCLQTDRNLEALQLIDLAIGLAPAIAGYHNNRYVLLTRLGRDREAARERERLLELDPDRAPTLPETDEPAP